ncbi:hypothetical protein ACFXJB_09285, partial [Streptomyces mirabilis]
MTAARRGRVGQSSQSGQSDFSRVAQEATDVSGREATPKESYELFRATYLLPEGDVLLHVWSTHRESSGAHHFVYTLQVGDRFDDYEGTGNGPLSTFTGALAASRGSPVGERWALVIVYAFMVHAGAPRARHDEGAPPRGGGGAPGARAPGAGPGDKLRWVPNTAK